MDSTQLKAQYKAGERNFKGVSLSGANLVWFELKGIDLRGADLSHANLSGANLSDANLSDAANFAFADLSRADLRNTNLKGTRLEGANLEGVQLEGAIYNEQTKFPIGFDPLRAGALASGKLSQSVLVQPEPQTKTDNPPAAKVELQPTTTLNDQTQIRNIPLQERTTNQLPSSSHSTTEVPKNDVVQNLSQRFKEAVRSVQSDWNQPSRSNQWTSSATPTNAQAPSTANTSGQGKLSTIPTEIRGWNWGACLLPLFWIFTNRVWSGLWLWLVWIIPAWAQTVAILSMIVFGAKGNEWAWKSRQWTSIAAFKNHQRNWAIAGFILWGLYLWNTFSPKK